MILCRMSMAPTNRVRCFLIQWPDSYTYSDINACNIFTAASLEFRFGLCKPVGLPLTFCLLRGCTVLYDAG